MIRTSGSAAALAAFLTAGTAQAAGPFVHPGVTTDAVAQWADAVTNLRRGPLDIANPGLGEASFGVAADALGSADGRAVSLGDGGAATLSFDRPIFDGPGDDFAVFELGFSFDNGGTLFTFAELGFVEVSTDGASWLAFESTFMTTPDETFGTSDRTLDNSGANNLAGLHAGAFGGAPEGTGFDLAELAGAAAASGGAVDLAAIFFIRITDVIGDGSTTDAFGNAILDPYPTAFATGGFDLDAVGAINAVPLPASVVMLIPALAAAAGLGRRRCREIAAQA